MTNEKLATSIETMGMQPYATINGTEGPDNLPGTAENDTIYGKGGNDYIDGKAGDDYLNGDAGNDTIYGGAGNDIITDIHGENSIDGGEGNDKITGTGTLIGGRGNDTITASVMSDSGDPSMPGGSDTFRFEKGDGLDTIISVDTRKIFKGHDVIEFGANITAADLHFQRKGNNLIIIYGEGDQITLTNYFAGINYQTINQIQFVSGSPIYIQNNMRLEGTDKNDNIIGSIWNDTIFGGAGNDVITDIYGKNSIDGGEGNDKITGTGTLIGGRGNDTITASVMSDSGDPSMPGGSDTFRFEKGDGLDTIISVDTRKIFKGHDVIEFGANITAADLHFQRKGNNLIIIYGEGDQITLTNYFAGINYQTINQIQFVSGSPIYIQNNMRLEGTDKNDNIIGSIWNDTIFGGAGNDVITDIHGKNSIDGGEGNDKITGTGTLIGGRGNDTITASVMSDSGDPSMPGGSDTFRFEKGDGLDTIISVDTRKIFKGHDVIEFGANITAADLHFQRKGNNLIIIYGEGDQITLTNYFAGINYQTINQIQFVSGSPIYIQNNMRLEGTDKNDNIIGSIWNDTIFGGAGNDVITDIHGKNSIDGGEGNDKITGTGTLIGGRGNDTITASVMSDSGDPSMPGGSDTFRFEKGDGLDTIISVDTRKIFKGHDVIEFGANITAADLHFQRKGNNLIIIYGEGDQITLTNYFAGINYQTINQIQFVSGSPIYIQNNMRLEGTDKNDNIIGSIWNDTIFGGAGNDVITDIHGKNSIDGGEGNDKITGTGTLIGGRGNDTITASVMSDSGDPSMPGGSDTFRFEKGDGLDTIISVDTRKIFKGHDVIEFGANITAADLHFQRKGNNLIIIYGEGDQITLTNYFAGINYQTINQIQFVSGSPIYIQDNMRLEGTDKNDNIIGSIWNDTIRGGKGNDIITDINGINELNGGEGNDKITGKGTLIGGKGNDILTANVASSSDVFKFERGDGIDTIISVDAHKTAKGHDVIEFGANITAADLHFQRKGNNLIIIYGEGDQITLTNYFAGVNYQTINQIKFASGSPINIQDNMILEGTAGNDNITGSIWNDTILGGAGNDIITDINGINHLYGDDGNDKITGTGTLEGGKGNDTLTANVAGSSDVFKFERGDGIDTIISVDAHKTAKGHDVIEFGANITAADLHFQRKGNNLIIIYGEGDQITLTNYFAGVNYQTINQIKFASGSPINIQDNMILEGTAGNDNITGSIWNDTILGGAGNDIITDINGINHLYGDDGNDKITGTGTLEGGKGNDTLTANVAGSSDEFIFNKGDGQDTIISLDTHKTQKGQDILKFGTGINQADLRAEKKGNNLILHIGADGDRITFTNYYLKGNQYQTIKTAQFGEATVNFETLLQGINRQAAQQTGYAHYENQANGLIDAMAAFAPAPAANSLIQDKPLDLGSVLLAVNAS